jgi:hypothetical protein
MMTFGATGITVCQELGRPENVHVIKEFTLQN